MLAAYEIVMTLAFVAVLAWALRSGNPVNLGAILGGFMLSGFDWLWCSRGFWNATIAPGLTMIPGIDIQGQHYPFSICFIWAVGFGFLPLFASKYHDRLGNRLGKLHFPVVFIAAAIIDLAVEAICTGGIGVWTYHQAPQYLLAGMVWSNTWFLGGLLTASYFGLARVQKWAALPPGERFSLSRENTWKGLLLAAGTILTSAALLSVGQLFWWSATKPWVESGRLF
jgi:hypothetical protein